MVPAVPPFSRRRFLRHLGEVTLAATGALARPSLARAAGPTRKVTRGRIRQSVVYWCFNRAPGPLDVEELARASAAIGLDSVELVEPRDWPILRKHGLKTALCRSHLLTTGWAHRDEHDACAAAVTSAIDESAAFGCPSVITYSGLRRGMSDAEGLENAVAGLKNIIGLAEKAGITLCLEVLNSRVNGNSRGHPDYMADHLDWAIELCRRVGSQRLKILFDIYHVQIMQGDVIERIRQHHGLIGHYHIAGVPGRGIPDESQELNYPAIMRAILETGYQGWVGHEFIPTGPDKLAELEKAVALCDV